MFVWDVCVFVQSNGLTIQHFYPLYSFVKKVQPYFLKLWIKINWKNLALCFLGLANLGTLIDNNTLDYLIFVLLGPTKSTYLGSINPNLVSYTNNLKDHFLW